MAQAFKHRHGRAGTVGVAGERGWHGGRLPTLRNREFLAPIQGFGNTRRCVDSALPESTLDTLTSGGCRIEVRGLR